MSYQVCGHCDQLLSKKTLNEHRRLYFDENKESWIKFNMDASAHDSQESSLLSVSPPGTDNIDLESSLESGEEQTLASSDEQPLEFDENFANTPGKCFRPLARFCMKL